MKKNIFLLIVSMMLVVIAAAQEKQYEVKVDGLSCPVCSYGLEKKLKAIDGVENIKIDLESGLVTFSVRPGKNVTEEMIKTKVTEAGYTFRSMIVIDNSKNKTK